MLILSRLKNETIRIDGPVTLTVTEIRGGKIKLGFTGPGKVMRGELDTVAGGRLSPDSPGAAASHNQE